MADSAPLTFDEMCRLIAFLTERGHGGAVYELVRAWVSRNALTFVPRGAEPA
jgi:hypothetical protein